MGQLVINNIKKSFGNKPILKGINLTLETGKVYGLLGNNGAGKTTLMRTIFNMVQPDEGTITYNGIEQSYVDYKDWFYFTETDSLPLAMTCIEYLKYTANLAKISKKEFKERLDEVNKILHPTFPLTNKITGLSSGQQKILGCMVTLIIKPKVIFLDEPTANMDIKNQWVVLDMVKSLKDEGRLIVIITHLIKEIEDSLTDVVILDDGIIKYSKPHVKGENLEKIFVDHTAASDLDLSRMKGYLHE